MTIGLIARRVLARSSRKLTRPLAAVAAGVAGVALASVVGLAAAAPVSTLRVATSSSLGEAIVVDVHGVTVYELRPETVHHLLCTKANGCFAFWPPVKVASATTKLVAPSGVTGRLGILHRNGMFQVTLAGHPLYRFAGDRGLKGMTSGQGLHSFHGTWHVVAAKSSATTVPTTTTTTTTTTTPTTTTPTTTTPYYPPGY